MWVRVLALSERAVEDDLYGSLSDRECLVAMCDDGKELDCTFSFFMRVDTHVEWRRPSKRD